jgi:hypothetical protein
MSARRAVVAACVASVAIAVGSGVWWARRPPPGDWPADRSLEEMRRGWEKEKEWSAQIFTPISDDETFFEAVLGIPVRLETALRPDQLRALQQLLYDQLVCRHLGSLSCYQERLLSGRQVPLDVDRRNRIELIFPAVFKRGLPEDWDTEGVFEQFWNAEYGDEHAGRRFEQIALGAQGSLVVIGEVASAMPESFLTAEEVKRWKAWPGARLWKSVEFHPGKRSLDSVIEKSGRCIYAEVTLILRSMNGEVWSWTTDWYLDPLEERWHLQVSVAATSRARYSVPF